MRPCSSRLSNYASRRLLLGVVLCVLLACQACGFIGGSSSIIPPFSLYTSVAVADLNGDGKPDIATCYVRIADAPPHPGFVAVYLQDPSRPGAFFPPVIYSVGNDPFSIAVGDLNGDGKPDIVTANNILASNGAGTSNVSVLLQDPGKPGQFLGATNYPTGPLPHNVAIGDLNGDGRPDLAVADATGISILFQNPGMPGSFLPPTTVAVASPPLLASSVAIGDLNGDGKADLVATAGLRVVVLLQNATTPGTFSPPTSYGAGDQPISVAVADLNGDGKPDLAVANLGSGGMASVSVLLQDPSVPGTFLAATNYKTATASGAVAIADLNGDGKPDLAVANTGALAGVCPPSCNTLGSVSVLLQDPGVPGHFQASVNYAHTDQVLSVAVGDMNGDNKPDLVVAEGGGIVIQFQNPAAPGVFLPPVMIPK